jgi:hypothetical protein
VSCSTTTSAFHLAMCYAVPQPVYFTWQYAIRYHNQCISPGNVLCGTTTSVFHLAMCHMVPRPVPFTWQCVMRYHDQYNLTICHTVPQTSVFHLAMFHTVPQPVPFTWQCVMRYHDQCISPGNVLCGTTTNVYIKSVGNISYDFLS